MYPEIVGSVKDYKIVKVIWALNFLSDRISTGRTFAEDTRFAFWKMCSSGRVRFCFLRPPSKPSRETPVCSTCLAQRDLAVSVVEDGGGSGARAEKTHAAPAEPAEEAALAVNVAAAPDALNDPGGTKQGSSYSGGCSEVD